MTGSAIAFGTVLAYILGAVLLFVLWIIVPFAVFRIRRESIEQTRILQEMASKLEARNTPDA